MLVILLNRIILNALKNSHRKKERGKEKNVTRVRYATRSWGKTMVKKMETRNRCDEKRRVENTQLRVRRYTGCIWDWENWWDLAEGEREWRLSGLQGPKHYWRWQFCAAAGRDSPFKRSPKKSFGKSSYGLCHPSDDGSFLYSASPPFSNYLLFSCFVKIQQVAHMGSNSTIKTSFASRVVIVSEPSNLFHNPSGSCYQDKGRFC